MNDNKLAVTKLLKDLEHEVWEFQSESDEEDKLICDGLRNIIDRVEHHTLRPKTTKDSVLFKARLKNILNQLFSDQIEELFEHLNHHEEYCPEGYPSDYKSKIFDELNDGEIKYLHDTFIDIQFSEDPILQGEDVRGVTVYPYN